MFFELTLRPARLDSLTIYPDQARKMVAAALDGAAAPPGLFNRDVNGKTLQGRVGDDRNGNGFGKAPSIVYGGGVGYLRIYGLGAEGSDVLRGHAGFIQAAISARHGPTAHNISSGNCGIDSASRMCAHRVHILVVDKSPKRRALAFERPEAVAAIRRRVVGGLVSQVELLGLACPIPRDEDIEILSALPYSVPIKPGFFASAYKDVLFAMPYKLSGPWFGGLLRSRGYGLIRMAREN